MSQVSLHSLRSFVASCVPYVISLHSAHVVSNVRHYNHTHCIIGKLPIIGVGGVRNGHDAYEKVTAGASLIEVYTSLALEGPPIVARIKSELAQILRCSIYPLHTKLVA